MYSDRRAPYTSTYPEVRTTPGTVIVGYNQDYVTITTMNSANPTIYTLVPPSGTTPGTVVVVATPTIDHSYNNNYGFQFTIYEDPTLWNNNDRNLVNYDPIPLKTASPAFSGSFNYLPALSGNS